MKLNFQRIVHYVCTYHMCTHSGTGGDMLFMESQQRYVCCLWAHCKTCIFLSHNHLKAHMENVHPDVQGSGLLS